MLTGKRQGELKGSTRLMLLAETLAQTSTLKLDEGGRASGNKLKGSWLKRALTARSLEPSNRD